MVERDHDDGSEGRAWETSTDRYWLERVEARNVCGQVKREIAAWKS